MAVRKIAPFQAMAVNGRDFLEFGPRYSSRPYDDTTVIQCAHRTLGGGVSVLFEREDFARFAVWLADARDGRWVKEDSQTTAVFTKGDALYRELRMAEPLQVPGALSVSISWNGSGRSRGVLLDASGRRATLAWVSDKDANGWEGWKSGRRAE
jgi:hypothetical protein